MTPITPPPFLLARLGFMFQRMQVVGMLEPMIVLGQQVQATNDGTPVARSREPLATLGAYIAPATGGDNDAQEGTRSVISHYCYFLPDPALTEGNYAQRWVQLPQRAQGIFRVATVQPVGVLYCWALLQAGGLTDITGNVK